MLSDESRKTERITVKILKSKKAVRLADDFFQNVNGETFCEVQLDENNPNWSVFQDIQTKVDQRSEEIVKEADEHKVVIEQLRKHTEKLKEDLDAKYAEIVVLYEDGVKKLTEMQNTFNADQSARKTAFDNAQREREQDFAQEQTDRAKAYEDEKNTFIFILLIIIF